MIRQAWVKFPTGWIERRDHVALKQFRWGRDGEGSTNVAALMVLMVFAHHCHPDNGYVRMTYDELHIATGLSRAKISAALKCLVERELVSREGSSGRVYRVVDYDPEEGWAKLPHAGLYRNGVVTAFRDFSLRKVTELDALKAYLLYVARRGRDTNQANISYDKIYEFSGIPQTRIRAANSVLINAGLINVQQVVSRHSEHGISNAYSLTHLDSKTHPGTYGRRTIDTWSGQQTLDDGGFS